MRTSRIACVTIPNFSIEVCLLDNQNLRNLPLALAQNDQDSAEIVAFNQRAAKAGVLLHMTVVQARVVCSNLTIKTRDIEKEIGRSNRIYKKLQNISPFVEEADVGLYYLDVAGLRLLYRDNQQLARKILAAVRPLGYPVKVGVAKNKFVARVAANVSKSDCFTIVSPGSEQLFLKPHPIEQLQLPADILTSLHDLGLRTIGQLTAFPANEMVRRFGPHGVALSKLARGNDTAFFEPSPPDEPLSSSVWLTAPLYQTTMTVAQVEELLSPLLDKLRRFSQGCSTIEIRFDLEDKTKHCTLINVERPSLLVSMFSRQLQVSLQKLQLSSPVIGITVTIPVFAALLTEQLSISSDLPRGKGNSASPCDIPDCQTITVPVQHDLILPERRFSFSTVMQARSETSDRETKGKCPYAHGKITGLRLIQPPREIEVTTKDSRPTAIRQPIATKQPTAVNCLGPWELSGGWWSQGFDRLYYEVLTADRQSYLLFLDRLSSRWFLQGVFD